MKYDFHEGQRFYLPESETESRPVRTVIQGLLSVYCPALQVWPSDEKRLRCWFPASTVLPQIPVHVKTLEAHEIPKPYVITIDVALPVAYVEVLEDPSEVSFPLECQWSRHMQNSRESLRQILYKFKLLELPHFPDSELFAIINRLIGDYYGRLSDI